MFELRSYQTTLAAKAADILRRLGLVMLFLQVRCGKTHIALEVARMIGANNVLFLTKKKAIKSIESDYAIADHKFRIIVTNYEQLKNIDTAPIDLFILDESHTVGCSYPKPSLRAKQLRTAIGRRPVIYLSGTPHPESPSQLFHQLWVTRNSPYDVYRNFYEWVRAGYVKVYQTKRGAWMINEYDRADYDRIKKDLDGMILTYSQEQAGFTGKVEEHFLEVNDQSVSVLMKRMFKDRILEFPEGAAVADTPASVIGKLHQLAGGSIICENGTAIVSEAKAAFIKEHFAGKRVVIFHKYTGERKILDKYFPDATDSPEDFQERKSSTFIGQIISAREGTNLSSADCIVMYAIDFAALSYLQGIARIQNLYRNTTANIYWVFFAGSIERRVYAAVSKKLDFTYRYFVKSGAI